jgi:hypothetical protein
MQPSQPVRKTPSRTPSEVELPPRWTALVDYYKQICAGRLGFAPSEFQEVYFDSQDLLPKIFTADGFEYAPVGPVSALPVAELGKNRIRLVMLLFYSGRKGLVHSALAWQGEHGFHMLSDVACYNGPSWQLLADIKDNERFYARLYAREERSVDWYLDVDPDI